MKALDDLLGWDTDGGDKQLCTTIDDDADQIIEFAFGVIVA